MTESKRYLTQFWFRIQEVYLEGIVSHQREVSVKQEQSKALRSLPWKTAVWRGGLRLHSYNPEESQQF